MSAPFIDRWVFLISGFTQNRFQPCGIEGLWMTLRRLSSPTTSVQIHSWDDDLKAMAQFVRRCSALPPALRITVIGYSWGGDAATDFCAHLERVGLGVHHLVLGDAVYRSNWLGARANWARVRSMTRFAKLQIPANVREVSWCYQRKNKPAGHEPTAAGAATLINPGVKVDCPHVDIDECDEFRAMALAAVEGA